MVSQNYNKQSDNAFPSYQTPPTLCSLAAKAVVCIMVYEDYPDCFFYRCDPVRIWEFEIHKPKKKKGKKLSTADFVDCGHPPPSWKAIRKIRDWWHNCSQEFFGSVHDSPLREHFIYALEQKGWTSASTEEELLFFLIRLCIDCEISFGGDTVIVIKTEWVPDIIKVIQSLGPFPLEKLTIEDDTFGDHTNIPCAIIQNSPHLQIMRIGQWELQDDILLKLGANCPNLMELSISGMESEIFLNDDAFFKCFFRGKSRNEVEECLKNSSTPPLSFKNLLYFDLLFCKYTEKLLQMITVFYPGVSLNAINAVPENARLAKPFLEVGSQMPYLRVCTNTKAILDGRLMTVIENSSKLTTIFLHCDDNFLGADVPSTYNKLMAKANESLKEIVRNIPNFEGLVLRPHVEVDITKVTLGIFSTMGSRMKSISFIYDISNVNSNTLFQLLNLCPELERLVIDISVQAFDDASQLCKTKLNTSTSVKTLILQQLPVEEKDSAEEAEAFGEAIEAGRQLAFPFVVDQLLNQFTRLMNLCIKLEDKPDSCDVLKSASVERLHLVINDHLDMEWITTQILPNFPNLKHLSLEGEVTNQSLWASKLESISFSSIVVTKKKPNFATIIPWNQKTQLPSSMHFVM